MDAATIKGVVDRMRAQGLVTTTADANDRRRLTVALTTAGQRLFDDLVGRAVQVTTSTLAPLTEAEATTLTALLLKLT